MRYRALGPDGAIVSAICMTLQPDPTRTRAGDWINMLFAALEQGVSTFEVAAEDPVMVDGLAKALSSVDRRLVFVSWRLGRLSASRGPRDFSPDALIGQTLRALERTGLGRLDAIVLDEPAEGDVPPETLAALRELKTTGKARYLGVRGEDDAVDAHIASDGFDILETSFNLTSGWRERNRLRSAASRDMAVIGYRAYPRDLHAAAIQAAKTRKSSSPLADVGSYGFLDATRGWTAEEICLSYALTEPSLATVQIEPGSLDRLERLAAVPEREMPPGLAAQIEMARFAPPPAPPADGRTRRA